MLCRVELFLVTAEAITESGGALVGGPDRGPGQQRGPVQSEEAATDIRRMLNQPKTGDVELDLPHRGLLDGLCA